MTKQKKNKQGKKPKTHGLKPPQKAKKSRPKQGGHESLMNSGMPRPYQRMRSSGDEVIFEGLEIVSSVFTTAGPAQQSWLLNPGNSSLFKRLSTAAAGYEKYRFDDLQLSYMSQCPVTRSGAVSAVIMSDPLAETPLDPPGFMAYRESFTGPIGANRHAVQFRPVDKRWYYVKQSGVVDTTDPTTRFQGRIVIQTENSATADVGLLSGYVCLKYVCRFANHKAMPNAVLALEVDADQKFTGGGAQAVKFDDILNIFGVFDTEPNNPKSVPGYVSSITYENSWVDYLGEHAIDYFFDFLGAATPDGKQIEEAKDFQIRPPVTLSRRRDKKTRKYYWHLDVGGAVVNSIPKWIELWQDAPSEEEKDSLLRHVLVSDLRSDRTYYLRGNAAGDITVEMRAYPNDGTTPSAFYSKTFSAGTGAQNVQGSVVSDQAIANCRTRINVIPAGVESRTLTGNINDVTYVDLQSSLVA